MKGERGVLSACIASRDAFDQIEQHISDGDFTEQGKVVLDGIREYYERDPSAERVDGELLGRAVARKVANPKHKETFERLVEGLATAKVSPANVVRDLIAVKLDAVGARIAAKLAEGGAPDDVMPLIEQYQTWAETDKLDEQRETKVGFDLEDLADTYSTANLIRLFPRALNERLEGGVLPGHHVLVFARPEMGKTLFLVNTMYGVLRQGKRVLYLGNEDPIKDVQFRMLSRISGKPRFEVLENLPDVLKEANEFCGGRVFFRELTPGTPREVEALVKEHEPDLVLIDQVRNLNMKEDNFVRQLEKAATAVRQIGKRNGCAIISVTQAGESATGKAVIDMSDVDNSKTGVPGAVDIMIGISGTQEDIDSNRRVISLPKNKRGGNHEFFPVRIDPVTNKIRSLE